jgi:hypothetical protein
VGNWFQQSLLLTHSLKAPGFIQPVNLKCDILVSKFAFKCDLHRYSEEWEAVLDAPSPFFSMLSVGDLGGAVQVEPS